MLRVYYMTVEEILITLHLLFKCENDSYFTHRQQFQQTINAMFDI